MSDHSEAGEKSQELCQGLANRLARRVPDFEVSPSAKWCGFYAKGRKRFAYVNHRKRLVRIEVWCLGELDDLAIYPNIEVEPRNPSTGGFSRDFQARFFLDDQSLLDVAADILFRVSYGRTT